LSTSTYIRSVLCPKHKDTTPSFALYTDGHGYCYTCGHHDSMVINPQPAPPKKYRYQGPLPWSMVEAYQDQLWGPMRHRLGWLIGRGLRRMTVEKLKLGHTGQSFTIPIWNADELETIKYRRDDRLSGEDAPKYRNLPGAKPTLYGGWQEYAGRAVILCEGELDAALLMQEVWTHNIEGVLPMSVTAGAQGLGDRQADRLTSTGTRVLLAYDQDEPGQRAAAAVSRRLGWVGVVQWPREWGKDVTEAIKEVGFEWWWTRVQQHLDAG
jgi:hypothetical protein